MKPPRAEPAARCRWAITVRGVVQGVGFRPFVYNAARARDLTGWVQNQLRHRADRGRRGPGRAGRVPRRPAPRAIRRRPASTPSRSKRSPARPCRAASGPAAGFAIRASLAAAAPRPTIPADLATCDLCLAEIHDPAERRWRYPFTNCTNCGPRWSIIRQLPYDRPRTSMAEFAMCPDVPGRVRRSGRPAVPRPADRLPAVRAGAGTARRRRAARWPSGPAALDAAVGGLAGRPRSWP